MDKETTIRIKESTKKRFKQVGIFGESYDDTINRLIEKIKKDDDRK